MDQTPADPPSSTSTGSPDPQRRWRWLEVIIMSLSLAALFLVPILFLYEIYILVSSEQFQSSPESDEEETSWQLQAQFQVEILAGGVVTLQCLQFVVCRERFQRSHRFLQWAAWTAYYLPLPLSAYALGAMLQFPCPYWLVAVFFAGSYSDSMAAYSLLQEDKGNMRRFAKRTLSLAYLAVALLKGGNPCKRPLEILSLTLGFLVFAVDLVIGLWATIPCSELCMMAAEAKAVRPPDGGDGPEIELVKKGGLVVAVGSRRYYEGAVLGCTTYADIHTLDNPQCLKDVCISSGLFIQLLQRSEFPHVDRSCVSNFFKELLTKTEPNYVKRAFGITEVQLAFLYDYFFCSRGSPSRTSYKCYMLYSLFNTCFLLTVLSISIQENGARPELMIMPCYTTSFSLILLQLCLLADYLTSNWLLVSYMCARATDSWYLRVVPLLLRIATSILELAGSEERKWQSMLAQCSIVEDFLLLHTPRLEQLFPRPLRWHPDSPVALSDDDVVLKTWVAKEAIHGTQGGPSAFHVLLSSAGLSWTPSQGSEVRTILICHIATWFCEGPPQHAKLPEEYTVATKLSRYCAYLVAFRQELLPWQHANAGLIFDEALEEIKHSFKGKPSRAELSDDKIAAWETEHSSADLGIFKQGIKLGKCLSTNPKCWEIMADFWTQTIIIMAQWGNLRAHIEHLAKGGEFVTHLWAFLSNAGIESDRTFIKQNDNNDSSTSFQASEG